MQLTNPVKLILVMLSEIHEKLENGINTKLLTKAIFLDGHVAAFAFLGGVQQPILCDDTRIAVAKILGNDKRKRGHLQQGCTHL